MKSDRLDHISRPILCRLEAGLLETEEIQVLLEHLLACSACSAAYRELLQERRRQPLQSWESLFTSWGKEDHLPFETLIQWLDSPPENSLPASSPLDAQTERLDPLGRDIATAHLLQCRLCRRSLTDLIGFVREERTRERLQQIRYRQHAHSKVQGASGWMIAISFHVRSKGTLWGQGRRWLIPLLLFASCLR